MIEKIKMKRDLIIPRVVVIKEKLMKNYVKEGKIINGKIKNPKFNINFVTNDLSTPELSNMKKNLGLNENRFNELVAKLKEGDEKLFEIAFEELGRDGIRSLKIRFKADVNSAKDVVIDSLLIFRNRLIDGKIKYGNLKYLFLKMTNQNYLRQIKKSSLVIAISDKVDVDSHFVEEEEPKYSDFHYKELGRAFEFISNKCKELLEKYYNSRKKTTELANEYGVSNDVIRKRKQRCLDNLRDTLSV